MLPRIRRRWERGIYGEYYGGFGGDGMGWDGMDGVLRRRIMVCREEGKRNKRYPTAIPGGKVEIDRSWLVWIRIWI